MTPTEILLLLESAARTLNGIRRMAEANGDISDEQIQSVLDRAKVSDKRFDDYIEKVKVDRESTG